MDMFLDDWTNVSNYVLTYLLQIVKLSITYINI